MNTKSLLASVALVLAGAAFAPVSQAAVVYSEGFDNGFTGWSRGDAYWSNCAGQGNCVIGSGGQSGAYFNLGTANGPEPDHRFFISSSIGVAANTSYMLTFFVRDDYAGYNPYNVPIQAQINGSNVGGIVKASSQGWNEIDLTWNSGAATSAIITLNNEYQLSGYYANGEGFPGYYDWGFGNDFAVDSVSLSSIASAVPEPASLALLAFGLAGLGFGRRKKA